MARIKYVKPRSPEEAPEAEGPGGPGQPQPLQVLEEDASPAQTAPGVAPEDWRDWAGGLPVEVLAKVAGKVVAQNDAAWAAWLSTHVTPFGVWQYESEEYRARFIKSDVEERKRNGSSLYMFARVCKEWRQAQLKVCRGWLHTCVESHVILPGRVALAKWALADGCKSEEQGVPVPNTMVHLAARHGHRELVQWLCGEGGFKMDVRVMWEAAEYGHRELVQWVRREQGFALDGMVMERVARAGDLEMVQWLRGQGCLWNNNTCYEAVSGSHWEVLRWVRENGCPWSEFIRELAAEQLGYTDDFDNLVDMFGNPVQ